MTFYIGVDPGLVTGVLTYDTETHEITKFSGDMLQTVQYLWDFLHETQSAAHHKAATEGWAKAARWVIALERYTLGTTVRTNQTHALETIGAVKFLAHMYKPNATVVMAGAADAAKPGSRENLIRVGWWTPSDPDQHHNKAAAQVALAMMNGQPKLWYALLTSQVIGDASDASDTFTRIDDAGITTTYE